MKINFSKWEGLIHQPTWYFDIITDVKPLLSLKKSNPEEYEEIKESVYDFFEGHLMRGDIVLGTTGKDWDAERKPIDSVIIHHTAIAYPLSPERLSAITLFRLYASYYANPYDLGDKEIKGQPIYSGHFRNGKQIFWPYHWTVRKGGECERLLNDNETGWQAGNWDVNCKSAAIVLDNNYESSIPSAVELNAVAKIIKEHYPRVKKENIFGHREINPKTTCPSNLFLSHDGIKGWKEELLRRI